MAQDNQEIDIQQKPKKSSSLLSAVYMVVAVLALTFGLRTFVFQPFQVPTGSMISTLSINDMFFSEKVSYYFTEPKAGDIITFDEPDSDDPGNPRTLVKRVIATEGQTVDLQNGVVVVYGVTLSGPYPNGKPSNPLNAPNIQYPYQVPQGHLWVMGDNRTSSLDSRFFGAIPVSSVSGRAIMIYYPFSHLGLLK